MSPLLGYTFEKRKYFIRTSHCNKPWIKKRRKSNLNCICYLFLTIPSGFMFTPVSHLSSYIKLHFNTQRTKRSCTCLWLSLPIYIFHFGSKQFVVKLYCMPFLGNDRKSVVLPISFYCLIYQGSFKVMADGVVSNDSFPAFYSAYSFLTCH